ncbi:MAG: threonine synthase [Hyphomonadaceae bacterium]|nr:threonine synthase [Hyphomonadaceae bacterium]
MQYVSTRGQAPPVSFLDAVLAGMAPDGGLYVPEAWPRTLDNEEFRALCTTDHFSEVARRVLHAFAGEALTEAEAAEIAQRAYLRRPSGAAPWPSAVTPLRQIGDGAWLLELFHGPSLSFKDVAMQLIAPLYEHALARRNERLSVVCATSGDTGGAAVEALKHTDRVDLFVLTPKGRVSEVQRRFMTASGAANVYALDIEGDFDACQAIVKSLFADADFSSRARLSGVNSINWARIVAQSVYFHIAANTLAAHAKPNFVVPTGNFGDAFSGWVAKQCGAPIGKIVLATNANDILTRTLNSGRYARATHSQETLSPAMDIQVASNFERILFEAVGRDGAAVRQLYASFAQGGGFDIPPAAFARLQAEFGAASIDDAATLDEMRNAAAEWGGFLACPHTAVGLRAARQIDSKPSVVLATAHPAKFPETVERASGQHPPLPQHCADLFARTEKFDTLPAEAEAVKRTIRERSRAWS